MFYVFLVVSAFISSPVICVKMAPDVIWYAIFFMLLAAVTKVSLVLFHTFIIFLMFEKGFRIHSHHFLWGFLARFADLKTAHVI